MKKVLIGIIGLLCSVISLQAQTNIYVCDGFEYDTYPIASVGNITCDGSSAITIQDVTYDIEDFDSITFAEPVFPTIKIVYSGTTASVTIPSTVTGVTCTSGTSSNVVINSTNTTTEYLYSVEGSTTNGSLYISGEYKLSLLLNGVSITSGKTSAINVDCGKRIDVILKEGTTSTLVDYASGDQKGAFESKGHLEFKGAGTLNVTGNAKHGIYAKEYIKVKGSVGQINILKAASDGIHCGKGETNTENNYFQMNGGAVTISNCASECIDTDDYGCAKVKGGTLTLNVSAKDGCGLSCDSIFTMTGGHIIANVSSEISSGLRCNYKAYFKGGQFTANVTGAGSRGMRGKKVTSGTVKYGGYLYFTGTNVDMDVSGGFNILKATNSSGIKADTELNQSTGDITITTSNSSLDIIATTDNWTGGTRNGQSK